MANPYREDFITIRREDAEAHGRLTPDMRLAFGACARCEETFPIAVDAIDQPAYASVDELVASATRLAHEIAKELTGAACPDCDAPLTLSQVAYHAWHAGLARDLVVRWQNDASELFTWEPGAELVSIARLAPADEQRLVRNAAFRADAMSLEVFLFLNDQEIASFRPGVEPKLAHLVFDMPPGSKALLLLLNEAITPEGKEIALKTTDVVGIEVAHPGGRAPLRSPPRDRPKTQSPGPRFELTIDDEVVTTFGNAGAGGLSFELSLSDLREEVEVTLSARGGDGQTWALPLLCAGQTASIRVLGPGLVDEPWRQC